MSPPPPAASPGKVPSANEGIKRESRHLRGALTAELTDGTSGFSGDGQNLLKFHGIYQQDDRDTRRSLAAKRKELSYSCMVRASVPGGALTGAQWLAMDALADEVADGTLRATSRGGVQWHFVLKGDVQPLLQGLNERLVTTLGACGDVVRNIATCPAHHLDRRQDILKVAADALAKHFRPRTRAYYEVWLDGQQAVTAEPAGPDPEEPLYGDIYLPRKFKFGIAWPGDNCVDIFTHDCGLIPLNADGSVPIGGVTEGYVVLVGGGLGMSYADPDTGPRLSDTLCWIPAADLIEVTEAVVIVQRDNGDRSNRKRARLKYVIEDHGISWFRRKVEEVLGRPLLDAPPIPAWEDACDHLGWSAQPDGKWTLGMPIPAGRIADGATHSKDTLSTAHRRSAIRAVIEQHGANVRLTPRQDMLLTDLDPADRMAIEVLLREHGVKLVEELGMVERAAMACPALPTCGQALTESERVLPAVVDSINRARVNSGATELPIHLRMTGCPHGCARPYTAELGVVGRTKSTYDLYVGGSVAGERLGERLAVGVKLASLEEHLTALLESHRVEALDGEGFGDFCNRMGADKLASTLTGIRREPGRSDLAADDE